LKNGAYTAFAGFCKNRNDSYSFSSKMNSKSGAMPLFLKKERE
jgi:hypothetical protein